MEINGVSSVDISRWRQSRWFGRLLSRGGQQLATGRHGQIVRAVADRIPCSLLPRLDSLQCSFSTTFFAFGWVCLIVGWFVRFRSAFHNGRRDLRFFSFSSFLFFFFFAVSCVLRGSVLFSVAERSSAITCQVLVTHVDVSLSFLSRHSFFQRLFFCSFVFLPRSIPTRPPPLPHSCCSPNPGPAPPPPAPIVAKKNK